MWWHPFSRRDRARSAGPRLRPAIFLTDGRQAVGSACPVLSSSGMILASCESASVRKVFMLLNRTYRQFDPSLGKVARRKNSSKRLRSDLY